MVVLHWTLTLHPLPLAGWSLEANWEEARGRGKVRVGLFVAGWVEGTQWTEWTEWTGWTLLT